MGTQNLGMSVDYLDLKEEFIHAVRAGDLKTVDAFLRDRPEAACGIHGADKNALHIAAELNHPKIVLAILKTCPTLATEKDAFGKTPASYSDGAVRRLIERAELQNKSPKGRGHAGRHP